MMFIDLIQTGKETRTSALAAYNTTQDLKVVGSLPHGYNFRPKTAQDRDNLVLFLKTLEYK